MTTREELFGDLSEQISQAVLGANPTLQPIEVEAFFADELVFASATQRDAEGAVVWRSSHAATPDSSNVADLAEAGRDLLERITADAVLSTAEAGEHA
ncbi:MAG: hypothetical protein ACOYBP_02410 [Microbacteriaceae bacterium]